MLAHPNATLKRQEFNPAPPFPTIDSGVPALDSARLPQGFRRSDSSARREDAAPLDSFFEMMNRHETGRALVSTLLERHEQLRIPSRTFVSPRPSDDALLPFSMCRRFESWEEVATAAAALSQHGFERWLGAHLAGSGIQISAFVTPGSAPPISVCTYNVWGTKSVFGIGRLLGFASHSPERFRRIGEELGRSSDGIVTLQEMWDEHTERVIQGSGFPYVVKADPGRGMWQKPGLVTLSIYPVLESEFREFTIRGGHERYVRKGVLRTRVQLPGGPRLDVFNTHLISPPEEIPLLGCTENLHRILGDASAQQIRLRQITEIGKFVRENKDRDRSVPFIVAGDFNASEGTDEYRLLRSFAGIDAFRTRLPRESNPMNENPSRIGLTYDTDLNPWARGRREPPGRLDYVFLDPELVRDGVLGAEQAFHRGNSILSDHFGVRVTVIPE